MINGYNKGFSLIELFIVITIMGILLAFAIPQFMVSIKDTKYIKAKQDLDALVEAIRKYSLKNEGQYPRDILQLRGYINKHPVTPWGGDYKIDNVFVYCEVLDPDDARVKPMILRRAYRNPGLMLLYTEDGFSGQGRGLYLVKPIPRGEPPRRVPISDTVNDPTWYEGGSKILYTDGNNIIRERYTFSGALTDASFNSVNLTGTEPSLNHTGTFLCYLSNNRLKISSGQLGTEMEIPNSDNCHSAVWSPSANAIACVDDRIRIFNNPEGRLETWLATDGPGSNPAWSPDGTMLAYDTGRDIMLIPWTAIKGDVPQSLLGYTQKKVNLTRTYSSAVSGASWSPDGTMVAAISTGGKVVVFNVEQPDNYFEVSYEIGRTTEQVLENVTSIHWAR